MRQLGLRGAFAQIVAIVITSLAVSCLITFGAFFLLRPLLPPPPDWPWTRAAGIATLATIAPLIPPEDRASLKSLVRHTGLHLRIGTDITACTLDDEQTQELREALTALLPEGQAQESRLRIAGCDATADPDEEELQVLVPLSAGQEQDRLEIRTNHHHGSPLVFYSVPLGIALVFLFTATAVLAIWAVARITRPLRRLAETAERFGSQMAVATVPEEGTIEIRQAARAFNAMQQRISAAVEERTRMLAAISHDFNTPLTRLRLRLETEPEGSISFNLRARLLRDITLLQSMVSTSLNFLRSGPDPARREWLDLSALLSSICDEFVDLGHDVSLCVNQRVVAWGNAELLERAVTNLVQNACQYGGQVRVDCRSDNGMTVIEVSDDGPGIPEDQREMAMHPFTRLQSERPAAHGNVGLGLSIVNEVAHAHEGVLELLDNPQGGLLARLSLPTPRRNAV